MWTAATTTKTLCSKIELHTSDGSSCNANNTHFSCICCYFIFRALPLPSNLLPKCVRFITDVSFDCCWRHCTENKSSAKTMHATATFRSKCNALATNCFFYFYLIFVFNFIFLCFGNIHTHRHNMVHTYMCVCLLRVADVVLLRLLSEICSACHIVIALNMLLAYTNKHKQLFLFFVLSTRKARVLSPSS